MTQWTGFVVQRVQGEIKGLRLLGLYEHFKQTNKPKANSDDRQDFIWKARTPERAMLTRPYFHEGVKVKDP